MERWGKKVIAPDAWKPTKKNILEMEKENNNLIWCILSTLEKSVYIESNSEFYRNVDVFKLEIDLLKFD